MSPAGRRRPPAHARRPERSLRRDGPVRSVRTIRPGVAFGAGATALTLAAAVVVPVATLTGDASTARRASAPGPGGNAQQVAAAPVDQIRAREWHLDAMRVPRAWRLSQGAGVTVAVLDTGVDRRHPDLVGRVTAGPDLTGGTRRPGSRYWGLHGTSMASIIAGHGNGPGQQRGVIGIAPQSRILSIRVTWENDDPQRREGGEVARNRDAVAQGIRYAVDHGAQIINMSLGGGRLFYAGNSTEEAAIRYALDRGVVLIASAGNDGAGPNRNNYPAAYKGVIAVGALDRRLRMWKDSNRRPYVAVCAPGVDIVSADPGGGYVIGTGTSPSSAIVAGVAALIRSRHPRLRPEEIRQALVQGSVPNRPTGSSVCPGPLDAVRALAAAARIEQAAHGPGVRPTATTPSPAPAAAPVEEDDGTLLPAILGGGAGLIAVGLLLAWRQRRPEEEYEDEPYGGHDEVEDYGLGAVRRTSPRAEALAGRGAPGGGPAMAPVNAPLWQSNEVLSVPPAAPDRGAEAPSPSRGAGAPPWPTPPRASTQEPVQASGAAPSSYEGREPGPPPERREPAAPSEGREPRAGAWRPEETPASALRPYVPEHPAGPGTGGGPEANGHAANGRYSRSERDGTAQDLGGLNGSAVPSTPTTRPAEPATPSYEPSSSRYDEEPSDGTGDSDDTDYALLDDEEWERFRRNALAGTGFDDEIDPLPREETAPRPRPEPRPGALRDAARPPLGTDHDTGHRPRHGEDDEPRSPWW